MRKILTLLLVIFTLSATGQVKFDDYFIDKSLRFDFMLAGDHETTRAYPLEMKEEPFYGGSLNKLVDPFHYGNLRYFIYDFESGKLIYSRGYGSLSQEWQTTAEAKKIRRTFYEVATFPYPKNDVRFVLKKYMKDGSLETVYERLIDPEDYFIRREPVKKAEFVMIAGNEDHHKAVDLAFIAEGYTSEEMTKFHEDVKRLTGILFDYEPFKDYTDKINIWAVDAVSEESGTDVPGERIYRKTALNSSFYTFDLARYLTTFDIKSVRDYAAVVPYDNIIVVINSERYGGGGMYNYYSGTTADHPLTPVVFVHEFGHGFAGLADEYYSSEVAYEEFYPLDVEPWEANITTLVDFESKWKAMIDEDTPVPTPPSDEYSDKVGLFEGGGYSAKGIYRPQIDCRMKSNEAESFCKVCQKALREMIEFYIR
ncbi:MAG: M64 family metallopeptidase [Bacteroidota bacterium]|nr:M64 family metallopeptidase [Bacteroidota bacterium]